MKNLMKTSKKIEIIKLSVIPIIFLFLYQYCAENSVDLNIKEKAITSVHPLMPSNVGSYWEFDRYRINNFSFHGKWVYKDFDSFGFNLDTVQVSRTTIKSQIIDSINVEVNDTIYKTLVINTGFNNLYYFGREGIYIMGVYSDGILPLYEKYLFLPKNISQNMTWNSRFSFMREGAFRNVDVIEKKCISINEKLLTPAGVFECHVIKTRIEESTDYPGYLEQYEYYAPNIGMVAKVQIFILPDEYWFLDYLQLVKSFHITKTIQEN